MDRLERALLCLAIAVVALLIVYEIAAARRANSGPIHSGSLAARHPLSRPTSTSSPRTRFFSSVA